MTVPPKRLRTCYSKWTRVENTDDYLKHVTRHLNNQDAVALKNFRLTLQYPIPKVDLDTYYQLHSIPIMNGDIPSLLELYWGHISCHSFAEFVVGDTKTQLLHLALRYKQGCIIRLLSRLWTGYGGKSIHISKQYVEKLALEGCVDLLDVILRCRTFFRVRTEEFISMQLPCDDSILCTANDAYFDGIVSSIILGAIRGDQVCVIVSLMKAGLIDASTFRNDDYRMLKEAQNVGCTKILEFLETYVGLKRNAMKMATLFDTAQVWSYVRDYVSVEVWFGTFMRVNKLARYLGTRPHVLPKRVTLTFNYKHLQKASIQRFRRLYGKLPKSQRPIAPLSRVKHLSFTDGGRPSPHALKVIKLACPAMEYLCPPAWLDMSSIALPKTLKYLHLTHVRVSGEVFRQIAKSNVRDLSMNWCYGLNDDSIESLIGSELNYLYIDENPNITGQHLDKLTNLDYLCLSNLANLTRTRAEHLKPLVKHLFIFGCDQVPDYYPALRDPTQESFKNMRFHEQEQKLQKHIFANVFLDSFCR